MMGRKITVVGTGYVGLVTGVCLAEIGHAVTCLDVDMRKIGLLNAVKSPLYEPDLEGLLEKNLDAGRVCFTADKKAAYQDAEVIYIAVGTPQKEAGHADLTYIEQAAIDIAENVLNDVIVVVKSTVPVGTNEHVKNLIKERVRKEIKIEVVSNPEFLREGSAVHDTFHGDRIVIGADNHDAGAIIEEINKPFGISIFRTDIRSAEMIKYASNAFLATKISFINEIAAICEKLDANVEDVASGMGMDARIGSQFLKAGIGYGGSCFPKDTNALVQIAGNVEHQFDLLEAVINVNNKQQQLLVDKALKRFGSLAGKRVAVLGLAFKPNTDDMREAASIVIVKRLIEEGAYPICYDPVAIENAKQVLPNDVLYENNVESALNDANFAFIVTEWKEIKELSLDTFKRLMKEPVVFDGRNCFDLGIVGDAEIEYYPVGQVPVINTKANRAGT